MALYGFMNKYPYTDFHELNLDWVIKQVIEQNEKIKNFIHLNSIKYADPIQWNITTQYEANTIVIDPATGTAYLSITAVPSGVAISDRDFWNPIFTLDIILANRNLTLKDAGSNIISDFESKENDWLLWNGVLYRVIRDIPINTLYVAGYNLERYTVEEFIDDLKNYVDTRFNNLFIINMYEKGCDRTGNNDCTDIINSVLANDTCNVLYFPQGVYKVEGTINIPSNKKIMGSGYSSIINHVVDEDKDLFETSGKFIEISNITIEGTYNHSTILKCDNAERVYIRNFNAKYFKDGLCFLNASRESFVDNFDLRQYNGKAIYCRKSNDIYFTNFLIIDEYEANIGRPNGYGIYIANRNESLNFENGDVVGGNHTLYMVSDGGSFESRTIPQYCRFTDVYFDTSLYESVMSICNDIKFNGCWFAYTGQSFNADEVIEGQESGLHVLRCTNISFVNCDFNSNGESGLLLETCENVTLSNSCMCNNNRYERNTIKNKVGVCLYHTCKNIVFTACTLNNKFISHFEQLYGARVEDNCDNIRFTDCIFDNVYDGVVNNISTTTSGLIIMDNQTSALPDITTSIATINTRNASLTTGRNCYLIGRIDGDADGSATVSINGVIRALSANGSPTIVNIPLKKGDIITTRDSGGVYDLKLYPMDAHT